MKNLEHVMKSAAKRWLPPVLADWLRHNWGAIRFGAPEWEYRPDGWSINDETIKGWNVEAVARLQKAKWQEFLQLTDGTGPLGIAHEAVSLSNDDPYSHHLVMAYGYVLSLASRQKDRLSLLDWGGGVGHYFMLGRRLVPDLELEYFCKDVPYLCEAGREMLPQVRFIERDNEVTQRQYNLVIASGSLQCVEDWKATASLLASVTDPYLYITRMPVIREGRSFVALQRVYAYGYDTEYLCWFLNRDEFLDHMASLGMQLVRELIFHEHPKIQGVTKQAVIQGYLFKAKS